MRRADPVRAGSDPNSHAPLCSFLTISEADAVAPIVQMGTVRHGNISIYIRGLAALTSYRPVTWAYREGWMTQQLHGLSPLRLPPPRTAGAIDLGNCDVPKAEQPRLLCKRRGWGHEKLRQRQRDRERERPRGHAVPTVKQESRSTGKTPRGHPDSPRGGSLSVCHMVHG